MIPAVLVSLPRPSPRTAPGRQLLRGARLGSASNNLRYGPRSMTPFLNHTQHLGLGLDLDQKLVHAWEHRGDKLHRQAKREPRSATAELLARFGLCEAKCTTITRALSLEVLGAPQNLLQSPARDRAWFCAAGVTVLLPAASGGVASPQEQRATAPMRSGCCLARCRALAGSAGACLATASSPGDCVTPLSVGAC